MPGNLVLYDSRVLDLRVFFFGGQKKRRKNLDVCFFFAHIKTARVKLQICTVKSVNENDTDFSLHGILRRRILLISRVPLSKQKYETYLDGTRQHTAGIFRNRKSAGYHCSRFTGGKNVPVIFIFYRLSRYQKFLPVKFFEFCPAAGKFTGTMPVFAGIFTCFLPVYLPFFRR